MMADPLDALSLRLLRLFQAVYQTRSITRAADALHTSQPSVSLSLRRLRQHLDDPLFVRVGSTMRPTARAEELIAGVQLILAAARDHFVQRATFDPATSDRRFTLHMTDPAETIVMPRLVERLGALAPGLRLRVRRIDADSQAMLVDGTVDLIVGYLSREAKDLYQCKLHDEHYVCIARADHPRIGQRLDAGQFAAEAHIAASITGTGHGDAEPGPGRRKGDGRIVLEVSSYSAIGVTVARTELIAVVPSRLGAQLAARGDIRMYPMPVKTAGFQVRQYWHPRVHDDAGNRWLRTLLTGLV